ncbi:hypothetical protein BJV78DRAFT_222727 [Lactifluus subvellereus]|nr:hypothetical protein BJV78DRAFT_222727 [Lactifluus subvellereus]
MAPSFLAFFSKRENARTLRKVSDPPSQPRTTTHTPLPHTSSAKNPTSPSIGGTSEQLEGSQLSLETEYVLADADSPTKSSSVYPLGSAPSSASASTTKIKIPFRKKTSTSTEILAASVQSIAPPRSTSQKPHKVSIESSLSDSPSLRPPPSRSAIFGSYADPHNTMSTRSLPQNIPFAHSRQSSRDTSRNYETMSNPDSHVTSPAAPPSEQSGKSGIFSWARPRARTKSKASAPDSSIRSSPAPLPADSFNLKSFRHVTPSTSQSPNPDPAQSGSPPNQNAASRSRTRENSFASESSQRISVAAFREVQARRSTAGSPVSSLPGDRDSSVSCQVRSRRRSSALGTPPPLPTSGSPTPLSASRSPQTRSPIASLYIPSSMISSESSDEGESESEKEATLRPNRQRTVTNRSLGATQSELGHRSSPIFSATRSDVGHGTPSSSPGLVPPSPRSVSRSPNADVLGRTSRNSSVYSRTRASVSTSALVPDAAAKRASMISKYSTASRPIQSPRAISRGSTSSESSSSSSSSSEDAPLSSRIAQRPGRPVSRAPDSPVRRPPKPLIDIGELVGGNTTLPTRTTEPLKDSPGVVKADSPTVRPRKTSLGIGERLSVLASGFSSSQLSRTKSPGSASDSRDEVFTPPEVPKMPRPPSPVPSPLSPPVSPIKPASRALGRRVGRPAIRPKSSEGPKVDTSSLNPDSGITPPPSSSTSSDAPIPFIKPRPIRERQEPPAFAVTSRPSSHASDPSAVALAALDKAIADADERQGPRRSVPGIPDQVKEDQQQQRRQTQPESQTTVRVIRGVPSRPSREDPLPVLRPHSGPRVLSTGVTVSNVRVTSPPLSTSPPASAPRHGPGNGPAAFPRKPFAPLRDSSPASSAGDSNSSRMPPTPRDGSELGTTSTGRPGVGHRKRASVTFADSVEDDHEKAQRSSSRSRSRTQS